jgi:hypothetical protein
MQVEHEGRILWQRFWQVDPVPTGQAIMFQAGFSPSWWQAIRGARHSPLAAAYQGKQRKQCDEHKLIKVDFLHISITNN